MRLHNNLLISSTAIVNRGIEVEAIDCYQGFSPQVPIFQNNDAYSNGSPAYVGGCAIVTNGINFAFDPQFVSAGTGNFHLKTLVNPTPIDAGTNASPSLPATDILGRTRIELGTVDLGVYQAATW